MRSAERVANTIDEFVAGHPRQVQASLERIRRTIRAAVPEVEEGISYRMPVFRSGGVLAYVGAFEEHIGVFPPSPATGRSSASSPPTPARRATSASATTSR